MRTAEQIEKKRKFKHIWEILDRKSLYCTSEEICLLETFNNENGTSSNNPELVKNVQSKLKVAKALAILKIKLPQIPEPKDKKILQDFLNDIFLKKKYTQIADFVEAAVVLWDSPECDRPTLKKIDDSINQEESVPQDFENSLENLQKYLLPFLTFSNQGRATIIDSASPLVLFLFAKCTVSDELKVNAIKRLREKNNKTYLKTLTKDASFDFNEFLNRTTKQWKVEEIYDLYDQGFILKDDYEKLLTQFDATADYEKFNTLKEKIISALVNLDTDLAVNLQKFDDLTAIFPLLKKYPAFFQELKQDIVSNFNRINFDKFMEACKAGSNNLEFFIILISAIYNNQYNFEYSQELLNILKASLKSFYLQKPNASFFGYGFNNIFLELLGKLDQKVVENDNEFSFLKKAFTQKEDFVKNLELYINYFSQDEAQRNSQYLNKILDSLLAYVNPALGSPEEITTKVQVIRQALIQNIKKFNLKDSNEHFWRNYMALRFLKAEEKSKEFLEETIRFFWNESNFPADKQQDYLKCLVNMDFHSNN